MVSGMSFDTGNFIVASKTATPCIKSLFYGLLEAYFAVYDSVVLTGPVCRSPFKFSAGVVDTTIEVHIVRGSTTPYTLSSVGPPTQQHQRR
jgi:hypothetical protein